MEEFFRYGEKEIAYLKSRDRRFAAVIDAVGAVKRRVIPDFFSAFVHTIAGQQISTKAHETIWRKITNELGTLTPGTLLGLPPEKFREWGLSSSKAKYIRSAAQKIISGELDVRALQSASDADVLQTLTSLDGVGTWSAEMLMLFSMQRPDVLSFGDFAIRRGLRMIYHHRELTRAQFEKYRRRFSPCGSVASLYIWAVAGGAIAGMKDFAPKQIRK